MAAERKETFKKPTPKRIGMIIRDVRQDLGLTQIELSSKLEISQATLSKIERAMAEPSASVWLNFCRMTRTDPALPLR